MATKVERQIHERPLKQGVKEIPRLSRSAFAILAGLVCSSSCAANLEWHEGPGFRFAALPVPKDGKAGFTLLPPSLTGITFTNVLPDPKAAENQIRMVGSGVACGDIDGDGWCDLYFCGLGNGNRLYRNLSGWKFEDITESAGVACSNQYSTGAVFADVDGNGTLDLLVTALGVGTRLFLNDGKGHFHEDTASGLIRKYAGTTMTLADVNGNGYLDLYVANYRTKTIRSTGLLLLKINGQLAIRPEDREDYELNPQGRIIEHAEPDLLYLNDGHGHFQAASWTNGIFLDEDGHPLPKAPKDWGLCAAFRDLNGDRAPDLYVCNDYESPDRLWINDGHGKFRAIARTTLRNTSAFSMAVDFADINRDGFDDLFVADMLDRDHQMRAVDFQPMEPSQTGLPGILDRPQVNRNTLQLNRRDATFAEVAYYSGLPASGWTWSCLFLDVDLDGYEDLLVSTGSPFAVQDLDATKRIEALGPLGKERLPSKLLMYPRHPLPRLAFRNLGDLHFEECGARWGFNDEGVSHGMALADLDNDGDLDVIMNSLNEAGRIYRNDCIAPRLAVRLKGVGGNTRGIGAKIIVRGGAVPLQSQEMMCGGRYLSGDDNLRVFAAGSLTNIMSIEVLWRSGKNSLVTNALANRIYEIDEGNTIAAAPPPPITRHSPLFEDVSQRIAHDHHDEPFDDFQRQPLLPKKLSQLGPGVAWGDVDGDGWDDLVIGTGNGGRLAAYRNNGNGHFAPFTGTAFEKSVPRDQTTVLLLAGTNRTAKILAGLANYEDASNAGPSVVAYELGSDKVEEVVGQTSWSAGAMALGDLYGEDKLCLFVGGRVISGHYPEPASSRVYRQKNGKFELDVENSGVLERVGLVSAALFTDLDGDGFPELVLACEWGPIRIFHNDHGHLREMTVPLKPAASSTLDSQLTTLNALSGWWNSVAAADLDGDGLMDLIAGDWGLNTKYRASAEHPRRIYYGDFAENGTVDTIEAYFDERMDKEVPERELDAMAAAMPWLRGVFPTHHAYGAASISEVLGQRMARAKQVSANTLASMIFLNRGDHFEARPLPPEAQFAPAFGLVVADFDGDGIEDVFLAQNFFATEPQTSRADAGRGLLLLGEGNGALRPVSGQESGIFVYGEQRGAAAADFDGDGRTDLVVAQNATTTKLYHNLRARPGLRVRLGGPDGNPTGIGAIMRLKSGDRLGPAREIHAGSGYWSQDSPVQVLCGGDGPLQVWVHWPGGKSFTVDVPSGAVDIQIGIDGRVTRIK